MSDEGLINAVEQALDYGMPISEEEIERYRKLTGINVKEGDQHETNINNRN